MTTLRKAAQAALALVNDTLLERAIDTKRLSAIGRDLEAAIAAEPAQPVAWRSWTGQCGYGYWESQTDADLHSDPDYRPVPLYTADAIREAVLAEREAISKFCADVYEKSASRDDGLDPFENGIKWTTEQISSWIEKRGAA